MPVPEFIDPVFVKTSPIRSFLVMENERFGLVFAKTGSINSGTGLFQDETLFLEYKAQRVEGSAKELEEGPHLAKHLLEGH
jgi:hypothetical protein